MEVRADFEISFNRLDSDDDDADDYGNDEFEDELYYEGTARSFNIISTQGIFKCVGMFKVLIKKRTVRSLLLVTVGFL